jgi:hypothetical protein
MEDELESAALSAEGMQCIQNLSLCFAKWKPPLCQMKDDHHLCLNSIDSQMDEPAALSARDELRWQMKDDRTEVKQCMLKSATFLDQSEMHCKAEVKAAILSDEGWSSFFFFFLNSNDSQMNEEL